MEATSRKDGLKRLIEHAPHAIILDITAESSREGYGVNEGMKCKDEYRKYRNIPIIMVPAIQESPEEPFQRSEEVGLIRPDRYITNPPGSARLLKVLQDCLQPRPRRE